MSEYPKIYFDTDPHCEFLGWVVRISETFSFDNFHSFEEAAAFLKTYQEGLQND